MASTITITCPECDKQMKAPAEVLGKKVRCKGCGASFPARAGAAAAPAKPAAGGKAPAGKPPAPQKPAAKPAADDDDGKGYGITEDKLGHRCPDCANEMESEDAVVCLHCGYNTQTRTKSRTRKVRDVTGGDVFMWRLPGILCAVAILILVVFNLIFVLFADGWLDPNEWYSVFVGKAVKIWLVVISLFIVAGAGKFTITRLFYENRPPEIEEK